MSWASQRKIQYILGLLVFISLIALAFAYPTLTRKPTCFDNKQNGNERGIDCGGSCNLYCSQDVALPAILWSRAFHVVGNSYNLIALVSNQNKNAAVSSVSYEFKVYDTNNLLIGRKVGTTYIPPNKQLAVFESRFDSGQSQIKSVTFNFIPPFIWTKKEPTLDALPIRIDNIITGNNINNPSLSARINNDSIYNLPGFDVVAILYDINHNAINASKTYKDGLQSNANTSVYFTWPEALTTALITQDIFVQINPFTTKF